MDKPVPDLAEVQAFLEDHHRAPVDHLELLVGGFWSSAYAYDVGDQQLVLRLGLIPEGFEDDRAAMAHAGPDLPVPRVLFVGEALGWAAAISQRHTGTFLEEVVDAGAPLARLLTGLRSVPPAEGPSWREWLARGLTDEAGTRMHGWRKTLRQGPFPDAVFSAAERRINELLSRIPERRDLVHGDLLYRNVLVEEQRATAVFSWKCSTRGDFLYDTAWCTFWSAWHPGIAAADAWALTQRDAAASDLVDAPMRHHCYELQIGASHFGWYVWTDDADELQRCAERLAAVLDRGPLSVRLGR